MAIFLSLLLLAFSPLWTNGKCDFPAIFNFGDSNSDTGGFFSAFPPEPLPFGVTYFKKPAGRASDGRVAIDFIAHGLGMPFLSPYLQSIGSNFRHGANYATSASTVRLPTTSLFVTGTSPFSLGIQLNQMKEFRNRVLSMGPRHQDNLPPKDVFDKSLYVFDIGQNDFTGSLASMGIGGVKQFLPEVASQIAWTIKEIYDFGGRTFMVFNLAPIGCFPAFLTELPHTDDGLDAYGCMISYNNAVVDYNSLLKDKLRETAAIIPGATIVYVDTHAVKLELYQHPKDHGLEYATRACCGAGGGAYNFNPQVFCGNSKEINGTTISATACQDPQNYVSWDGVHATEAANRMVAWAVLNGSYSDPPFPFSNLCDLQPLD